MARSDAPGGRKSRPIITVGASAPVYRGTAVWFDGRRPIARQADLAFDDAAAVLRITPADQPAVDWVFGDIRTLAGHAGETGRALCDPAARPVGQIIVAAQDLELIETRAPRLHRPAPGASRGRALGGLILAAALALGALAALPLVTQTMLTGLPQDSIEALRTLPQVRLAEAIGRLTAD